MSLQQMKFGAAFVLLACAGIAQAQPVEVYASGLLHQSLGSVSSMTVNGRRLTACCLGSSGEDGVEIQLRSVAGGGVVMDLEQFMMATGALREIKIRLKGWDGTIKGTHRMINPGGGPVLQEADFSPVHAVGVLWTARDEFGNVLATGTTTEAVFTYQCEGWTSPPGTPLLARNVLLNRAGTVACVQDFGFSRPTLLGLGTAPIPGVGSLEMTPMLPPGEPDIGEITALQVTGAGMPELALTECDLATFSWGLTPAGSDAPVRPARDLIRVYGLGQAHIDEECIGVPPPCASTERRLPVRNLGSSGEDGVAVEFPPGTGDASFRGSCCRGHVIIMKLYDEGGTERTMVTTTSDPASGAETISVDFQALGSPATVITVRDSLGNPVAEVMAGHSDAVLYEPGAAGGTSPTYRKRPDRFDTSLGQPVQFHLPGGVSAIGTTVSFAPATIAKLPTLGKLYARMMGGSPEWVLEDVSVHPPSGPAPTCDFNQDGGADNTDVTDLANSIASGSCP